MKTTLKTTALAILVALGATACLSNSGGGGSKEQPKPIQPTNPTQPTNPDQSNGSNGQNDTNNSSNGKTTPPSKDESDKGKKGDDSSKDDKDNNGGENQKPQPEDKNKIAEITVVTPEGYEYKSASEVNGVSWRVINLAVDDEAQKDNIFNISSGHKLDAKINLDELSENELTAKQAETTLGKNKINYAFVNQPYSSYGILTTETQDKSVAFVSGYEPDNKTIDKLTEGEAKYNGNVLATISTNKNDESISDTSVPTPVFSQPQYDGKVELTLKIDHNNEDEPYVVSGKIDSKLLNKTITLADTKEVSDLGRFNGNAEVNGVTGLYAGQFTGKEHSESVGIVKITDQSGKLGAVDGKAITGYQAAFGATK